MTSEPEPHDPATDSAIPEQVGPYRVERLIAAGGMGRVYEAVQENPRRAVALKVMGEGIVSKAALRRFEYEAQLLGRLRHPGIAQIYEAGTHRDGDLVVPFFAMEFVPGARTLIEYADEEALGVEERIRLFVRVCEAVHHGHLKGIIHRDLKPGNVLVDSSGNVKVIDFGVARSTDSDVALATFQTEVGQLLGTLQYMSPEQCEADPNDIDSRSDVYALGVILYELLAGRLPYDLKGVAIYEATRVIKEDPPTRLSTTDRHLRGDLETIAMKALEKDRERRYGSATDLSDDLKRFLSGDPISARPPSLPYQLRMLARRHKAAFGAGVVTLLALVGGAAASVWGLVEARRGEELARDAEAEAVSEREAARAARDEAVSARSAEARARARAEEALLAADEARAAEEAKNRELDYRAYTSTIAAADGAIRTGNTRAAREYLARLADSEHRGWEWTFLAGELDHSARTLFGHFDRVAAVAVSPDGTRVASTSHAGRTRIWDHATGRQLASFRTGAFTAGANRIEFSPDGAWVFTPAGPNSIGVYAVDDGRLVARYDGTLVNPSSLGVAPLAGRIAACGETGVVWDMTSGEKLLEVPGVAGRFVALALSPDGSLLALRTMSGGLFVYDVDAGRPAFPPRFENSLSLAGLAFDPSGERLASFSGGYDMQILDPRTGEELERFGPQGQCWSVDWSPDGTRLVLGALSGPMEIWVVEPEPSFVSFLPGHGRLSVARFHPDGRRVASGAWDSVVKLWDAPQELVGLPQRQQLPITAVAPPDGSIYFLTGYADPGVQGLSSILYAWDPIAGEERWSAAGWLRSRTVGGAALSARGDGLLVGLSDGTVALLDAETGDPILELERHGTDVRDVVANRDATLFAVAAGSTVRLHDGESFEALLEVHAPVELSSVAFSDDGRYLVAAGLGALSIWDAESGFQLWEIPVGVELITSVAFVGDSSVATLRRVGRARYTLDLWDLASDPPVSRTIDAFDADLAPPSVFTLPGGERFGVASINPSRLPVYDASTGRAVIVLRGHMPYAYFLAGLSASSMAFFDITGSLGTIDTQRGADFARELEATARVEPLVDRLLDETLSLGATLDRLRDDPDLTESERSAACQLALGRGFDLDAVVRELDLVVYSDAHTPEAYAEALRRALSLRDLRPGDAESWRRLGYAQYRTGRHGSALDSFARARELAGSDGPELGFEAMALARLDRSDEAHAALGRFEEAVRRAGFADEYRIFLLRREAERVVGP